MRISAARVQSSAPQAVEREQHRRRVGAAAAQPAAQRNPLVDRRCRRRGRHAGRRCSARAARTARSASAATPGRSRRARRSRRRRGARASACRRSRARPSATRACGSRRRAVPSRAGSRLSFAGAGTTSVARGPVTRGRRRGGAARPGVSAIGRSRRGFRTRDRRCAAGCGTAPRRRHSRRRSPSPPAAAARRRPSAVRLDRAAAPGCGAPRIHAARPATGSGKPQRALGQRRPVGGIVVPAVGRAHRDAPRGGVARELGHRLPQRRGDGERVARRVRGAT